MKYWLEIGPATSPPIVDWLLENVSDHGIDWVWNDDSCGHYFICFHRADDAVAFRLKFDL